MLPVTVLLERFLRAQTGGMVGVTFVELDERVGALPRSARTHRE